MAAMVHGCGSPRQVHSNSGNINNAVNSGCLPSGGHRPYSSVAAAAPPMYPSTPKYPTRNAIQQQLGGAATNLHHAYAGANPTSAHKYPALPPPVAYYPMAGSSQPAASPYGGASDACRTGYWGQPHAATMIYRNGRHHYSKRKSAVELLAETKQYYIKSDAALERLHQSAYRNTLAGTKRGRSSGDTRDELRCSPSAYRGEHHGYGSGGRYMVGASASSAGMHPSGGRSGSHMHHHHGGGRTLPSTGSSALLQSKLRMMFSSDAAAAREMGKPAARAYRDELSRHVDYEAAAAHSKEYSTVSFADDGDSSLRTPPPPFLSAQPYGGGGSPFASSCDEPLVLTENYRPISPPAEYAGADCSSSQANNEQRSRYNYQRSYSHSHEMAAENAAAYNINSHKSLPDLHAQISRHSPHSEILSCCSRGNRSIKSAGESSLNRDSGGSSGHYTHRSEPCYRQHESDANFYGGGGGGGFGGVLPSCCQPSPNALPKEYRRDSGSSTQHSYCGYASPSYPRTGDCSECRCKAAAVTTPEFDSADFLLNFTTPEVPEAFQDDYTPPSPSVARPKLDEPRYSSSSSQQLLSAHSHHSYGGMKHHHSQQSPSVQSPGSAPSVEEISPPPIQFKRQKCIRFKNRSRISLPSAAVHGGGSSGADEHGYQRSRGSAANATVEQQAFVFPKCFSADGYAGAHDKTQSLSEVAVASTPESEGFADLERFFDRLGLNDDKFHEIYSATKRRRSGSGGNESDDSTVFFSDVSTVDSMRLPDSTETQPQATQQTYRPSEPPSIVERNARIIKWLCNCRKVQYAV